MIESTKTASALINQLQTFCTANNLELIGSISTDELLPGNTYIKQHVLENEEFSVGLGADSSDIEFPIYQIDILTPKSLGEPKNKMVSDLVKRCFRKASFVFDDGEQTVQVQKVSKSGVIMLEKHAVSHLSVDLTVIATNT